ncbi:MAG: DUF4397 domain-containing protein [Aggregatilineales bacterium]
MRPQTRSIMTSGRIARTARIALIFVIAFAAWGALSAAYARPAGAQAASGGMIRFVHALPGGPAIDVFVDNVLAARNLAYGSATRYLNVPFGDHKIVVTPTGTGAQPSGTPILSATVTSESDRPAQLVVVDGTATKPEAGVFVQDLSALTSGKTRFTAVHAIKDAPAIDILRPDGSPLIQGLKYGDTFGGFDTDAGAPGLAVVPAGGEVSGAIIQIDTVALDAGTHYTLVAMGTVSGSVKPSYLLLSAPTALPSGEKLVRFVNGLTGGKAIDIYVNGTLIAPDLATGEATLHLPFAAGDAKIDLRNAGDAPSATVIGSQTLTLKDAAQTAVVTSDSAQKFAVTASADDISTLKPTTARVHVIDATGGNTAFTFNNAPLPASTNGTAQSGDLAAGKYDIEADGAKTTLTLNGGTLTDLILIGTSGSTQLVIATTGLSEQPGSVPTGAGGNVVAAQPTTAASPTAASGTGNQTNPSTPSPVPAATTTAVPQPTATITPVPGVIGTVATDPGVNLKVRQYPRPDALTLALVPSEATLNILGVRGPAANTGTPGTAVPTGAKVPTPTIVATTWHDIWLYVSWTTPDGGTVSGWTIAQFLNITINGKSIASTNNAALLSLKQIPANIPGEVTGTKITPVADTNNVIGTITTNPGTNAQLRRTPNVAGESLALVPSGATVIVLQKINIPVTPVVGAPTSPLWYFVRYDANGSSIFGWMSADFIKVTFHGRAPDPTQIPIATEITRGFIQGNATQVGLPTAAGLVATVINLSPGANLQFRATPSANGQSLGLIPLDTQLPILGRNGNGSWIQVQFQGQTGWVDSAFVSVTKNGRKTSVGDLPVVNGEPNTFGTGTPTSTPTGVG